MKNFLITPTVKYSKKRGYIFFLEKNWFNYSKKLKINLLIYNFTEQPFDFIKKNKIKGVILSGGNDLSSLIKKKENHFRDKKEIELINFCIKNKVPILAVCRGFQVITNLFGSKISKCEKHVKKNHRINILPNNYILQKSLDVNSYHNYNIKKLVKNFDILGKHSDNSIEIAIYKKNVLCFMFHPERKNISQKTIDKVIKKHFGI